MFASNRRAGLLAIVAALSVATSVRAQEQQARGPRPLRSVVIPADSARSTRPTATGRVRSIMDTTTALLSRLESHVTTLAPGVAAHAPHRHVDEELIILRRGTLEVTQESVVRRAGPGSVIFQASNELHGARNIGADTAEYYVIRFAPSGVVSTPSTPPSATDLARSLLGSLADSARSLAAHPFDSIARLTWNYVPMDRAGVPLGRLNASQRSLVDALLGTALGPAGVASARRIIEHESILRAIEQAEGRRDFARRDPDRYFTSIFGAPSSDGVWGWRFEGHHLSVNVTSVAGQSHVAPVFMGANPARVPSGPHAGLRILAAEEDLARTLVRMLPPARLRRARFSDTTFGEILTRNDPKARSLTQEGIAFADLSREEQQQFRRLLDVYLARLTTAAARDQLARIERAGMGHLRFAWAGSLDVGKAHYYRIHGPTLLIEYDNTQTNANHVHTVWRDLERDFGGDVLKAHYTKHRH
jgi:hypothetical protein